jgi:hypothetical protein
MKLANQRHRTRVTGSQTCPKHNIKAGQLGYNMKESIVLIKEKR